MILLVYFGLLFVVFALRRSPSPAWMLAAIYVSSLVCGVVIRSDYQPSTIFQWFNVLFVAAMLTLLMAPWNAFPFRIALAEPNEGRVRKLTWFLLAIHSVGFVIFSIAFYYAFTRVFDYSAFKNEGESIAFNKYLPINHTLHLLVTYLNATAAFLVPLHFYHLLKRRFLLSILSLVLSLNIVLEGIAIFSRSGIILYFMLYLLYVPFFWGKFDRKQRRMQLIVSLVVLTSSGAVFWKITSNRFSSYLSSGDAVYTTSNIQNPEIYSVLDYASQWYKNGNDVMAQYSFRTLNGELSLPIVTTIADKIGLINYPEDTIPEKLKALWGDRYDKFVGLVANLLFDFGYVGTTLFALLYWWVLRQLRPARGSVSVATLLVLGPMFVLPAMGVQNSVMKMAAYNLLIVYSIVVYAYLYSGPKVSAGSLSIGEVSTKGT